MKSNKPVVLVSSEHHKLILEYNHPYLGLVFTSDEADVTITHVIETEAHRLPHDREALIISLDNGLWDHRHYRGWLDAYGSPTTIRNTDGEISVSDYLAWAMHYPANKENQVADSILDVDISELDDRPTTTVRKLDDESDKVVLDKVYGVLDRKRKSRVRSFVYRFIGIPLLLVACILVAGGMYLPDPLQFKMKTRTVTDNRPCVVSFKDGTEIHGVRSYTYSYNQLFGVRWNDQSTVKTVTRLKAVSTGLLVSAHNADGTTQELEIREGEHAFLELPIFEQYTFVVNNNIRTYRFDRFCR